VILFCHTADEATDFSRRSRSAASRPGSQPPAEAETGAMPTDKRLRLDDDEDVGPAGPDMSECSPEQPVRGVHFRTWPFASEDCDLLSQRKDFEGGITATAEEDTSGGKESEGAFEHGPTLLTWRNLASATRRLQIADC